MTTGHYQVFCDKPSDKVLVEAFARVSAFWNNVSRVEVIPNVAPHRLGSGFTQVIPLLEYDRPDFIIMRDNQPVLVVEITEHGYTGDNPLQRFARVVRAAEMGVPLVHFTPFARTRFDEMLYTDDLTSARRVSSRLFEGFIKLTNIYHVPVVAMDWPVNTRGVPVKPRLHDAVQVREVFGELIEYTEHLCVQFCRHIIAKESILGQDIVSQAVEVTRREARRENILDSEIRLQNTPFDRVCQLIANPRTMVGLLGEDYFLKGKDHKLVALRAINESAVDAIETPRGFVATPASAEQIQPILPRELSEKPWLVLYSGYEWRGQPNGGIVANTEILYCRTELGTTVRDRHQYLAVFWPRVFYDPNHPTRTALLRELRDYTDSRGNTLLEQLIQHKREIRGSVDRPNYIAYNTKSIGGWSEGTTVTRIYRHFCDLVILNDRVLLGDHWKEI